MEKPNGLIMLNLLRRNSVNHPTLIVDDQRVMLIDTGLPDQYNVLNDELIRVGFRMDQVTDILITHHDMDHMGIVKQIKGMFPSINVLAHRIEVPYINGTLKHLKLDDIDSGRVILTEDRQTWYDNLVQKFPSCVCEVDEVIEDGQIIDIAGGLQVILTAGHTLGQVSLFHPGSKTLISADALNIKEGILSGPNPIATHDLDEGMRSIKKLADFDIQKAIVFHGGWIESTDLSMQLHKLADDYFNQKKM